MPFITITPNNGCEFAANQLISQNIGCDFFFAKPYHSWERGLNEYINGNIRYFLPKKTDFANTSHDSILHIQNKLNNRSRKSLGFLTPAKVILKYIKRIYPKNNLLHLLL